MKSILHFFAPLPGCSFQWSLSWESISRESEVCCPEHCWRSFWSPRLLRLWWFLLRGEQNQEQFSCMLSMQNYSLIILCLEVCTFTCLPMGDKRKPFLLIYKWKPSFTYEILSFSVSHFLLMKLYHSVSYKCDDCKLGHFSYQWWILKQKMKWKGVLLYFNFLS